MGRDLKTCRIPTGNMVRIAHDRAMDPHGALEWERFIASVNVKTWTPWRR